MDSRSFTHDPGVRAAIRGLKENAADRQFSDIVDGERHQYVDLVMEGGGVLGIALLGYTYALEAIGVRFLGIGGTSAGSISALLLAALDRKDREKSAQIALLLASKNLYDFVDGDPDVQDFVKVLVARAGGLKLGLKALQVFDTVSQNLGLNPGNNFLEWLTSILADNGITRSEDLEDRVSWMPEGLTTRNGDVFDGGARLALITAEVSTETKVELPRMASLFWKNPQDVNPALFVRASMSIPFFFHPFRVSDVPQDDAAYERWERLASFDFPPHEAVFIDGGIMSNFPIDVFHEPHRVPVAPTFGVKLGTERRDRRQIGTATHLLTRVFDSARHSLDYDFITRNPDYHQLVTCIDTGPHHWLNFQLSDEDKVDLFRRGVEAATNFVYKFDWKKYKKVRGQLAKAYSTSGVAGGSGE
ncbi:MAG TPA: patatin-like phospholipase family protein [Thermoanaerobaculia bacterium]|nr:patatin-like phospholipase family protein [Thermoanaerobaculia bacterium]